MVRYLHPADHNPKRIAKADKDFARRLDFREIKFPVKTREIYKIEKKNSIGISVFGYENKEKHPIYVSKNCCQEKHLGLLLKAKKSKALCSYQSFQYIHDEDTLHRGRKHFCHYTAFSQEEILKRHIKDCFKVNGKKY